MKSFDKYLDKFIARELQGCFTNYMSIYQAFQPIIILITYIFLVFLSKILGNLPDSSVLVNLILLLSKGLTLNPRSERYLIVSNE